MNFVATPICLILLLFTCGCNQDPGSADVEGKPALKLPEGEKNKKGISQNMGMDPVTHMLLRLDKNKDGKINADEIPSNGLPGYDQNEDGEITPEEIREKYRKMAEKGKEAKESKSGKEKVTEKKSAAGDEKSK